MPLLPRRSSSWADTLWTRKAAPMLPFGWSLSGHLWVALSWPSGPWVLAAPGLASCELKCHPDAVPKMGTGLGVLTPTEALLPGSEPEEVFYGPGHPGFAAKGVGPILWLSVEQV